MNSIPCPLCKGRDYGTRCEECEGLGYIAFATGEEPRIATSIDKNVASVRAKLLHRSEVGQRKYGCTTDTAGLTRLQWLRHAQEEACDFAVYLEELIREEEAAQTPPEEHDEERAQRHAEWAGRHIDHSENDDLS